MGVLCLSKQVSKYPQFKSFDSFNPYSYGQFNANTTYQPCFTPLTSETPYFGLPNNSAGWNENAGWQNLED